MTRPEGGTSRWAGRAAAGWWTAWWPPCGVREQELAGSWQWTPGEGRCIACPTEEAPSQWAEGGLMESPRVCCTWRGCVLGLSLGISCQGADNCRVCGSCRCLLSSLLFTDDTDEAASVKGAEWLPRGPCVYSPVLATLPGRLKWRSSWKSVIMLESQAWF